VSERERAYGRNTIDLQLRDSNDVKASMSKRWLIVAVVAAGCASHALVGRVQTFRRALASGDLAAAHRLIAPDAREWYEEKKGPGIPYVPGGGRWSHWDSYFHSQNELTDWRVEGRNVTATVHEMNDFMTALDWHAPPYTMTWTFDDTNRISQVLIKSGPGQVMSRLQEFRSWAQAHDPAELEYLMPKGKLDPTGDRPERWQVMLEKWKASR